MSWVDTFNTFLASKAVWTTAYVNNLPDSSFLYILPGGKKDSGGKTTPRSLRMFPYKNAEGKIDLPHLRNAIARIPQSNRIDDATKKRLQTRARKLLGQTGTEKSSISVFKAADGQWWFLGIYSNQFIDRDGEILSEEAHKEYIDWVDQSGFRPVITVYHEPHMPEDFWVKVYDKWGDDIPTFQKIVDRVYKNVAIAKAVHVAYANGFVFVAAKFLPGKEDVAQRLSALKDWGMSHGFLGFKSHDNIFDRYRTFEMSALKVKHAANLLTLSQALARTKEKSSMGGFTPEKRSALVELFDEEAVAALEANSAQAKDILSELGLDYKEFIDETATEDEKDCKGCGGSGGDGDMMDEEDEDKDEDKDEEKEQETAKEEKPETDPELTAKILAAEIAKTFVDLNAVIVEMQKTLSAQADQIAKLEAELQESKAIAEESQKTIAEIKQDEDAKIAAQFLPQLNWRAGYSASKADETVTESAEDQKPGPSNPNGSKPVEGEGFLNAVFWNTVKGAM